MNAAVVHLQYTACPACGTPAGRKGVDVPDHEYALRHVAHYVECPSWGTLSQQPMPTLAELPEFYPSDYHSMFTANLIIRIQHRTPNKKLIPLPPSSTPIIYS